MANKNTLRNRRLSAEKPHDTCFATRVEYGAGGHNGKKHIVEIVDVGHGFAAFKPNLSKRKRRPKWTPIAEVAAQAAKIERWKANTNRNSQGARPPQQPNGPAKPGGFVRPGGKPPGPQQFVAAPARGPKPQASGGYAQTNKSRPAK